MSIIAPDDGLGWYIIEVDDAGRQSLRHWLRYNLREAAICDAKFRFPNETGLTARFWDGKAWVPDTPTESATKAA